MEMATWPTTTESPFTREMRSMSSTKRIEKSSVYWTARRLNALLTCVSED